MKINDGKDYSPIVDSFYSAEHLEHRFIEIVGDDSNCGFGAGHNAIIRECNERRIPVYVGCNPDGLFHHDAIYNFLSAVKYHPSRTLFEFHQFPEEHPKVYDCFTGETPWASGACFGSETSSFIEIGGFDDNIRMYCEDVDLSWRFRIEGGRCVILSNALFYHDVSDKRDRESVRVEMLKSGRYLAWKWKSDGFQRIMEDELVRLGVADEIRTLPPLRGKKIPHTNERINEIVEFRRLFSFSPIRW
ncbi:hypothetical protein A5481_07210 [Methylobacterium platani]|uniref:Glycosyltransferase 2-like domain-containing protein n=2 Tax=Methylobacterium platani TaxID=427683 RepID=A0A179SFB0_9HYPH|nr:hypothetical protein A5481_07210 [Methylobacterium platani]